MSDEAKQPSDPPDPAAPGAADEAPSATPAAAEGPPPGHVIDAVTGLPRPMTFMERARIAATQAAKVGVVVGREAARVGAEVGKEAAKVGAEVGTKAARVGAEVGTKAATTIRDPATQARARSALKKAKRGFTTVLERIDPRILADVVVRATSLQEKANASLKERGSAYRIGEITIGAAFPPSIHFAIQRVDDPEQLLHDSSILLAKAIEEREGNIGAARATIVGLDGTTVDVDALDALEDEDGDEDEDDDGDEVKA